MAKGNKKPLAGVATVTCTCKHEQQDKMYGTKRRLANVTQKDRNEHHCNVRCSVCSAMHGINVGALR